MKKMYNREVTKREPVNKFGRLGYVLYSETVVTDDIDKFNARKKIRYHEVTAEEDVINAYIPDQIYSRKIKTLSKTW